MPLQVFVGFVAMMTLKVAIGPQNAFVLRQGIRREYVLVIVALCGIADGALIAAGVGGFAALIHAHPNMTLVARFGGAAFLIGYALLAARNEWRPSGLVPSESGPAALIGVVQMCLVVTFLNPHVYLDTVVLIGALANEESDLRWFFGAGAWAASVVWFAVLGFSAGRLQPFFATPAAWRILDALVAVTMIGVAVVVLVTSPSVPTANVALII